MGTFRIVTKSELRTRRKLTREDLVLFDEFKEYIQKLAGKEAAVYEFDKGEDSQKAKKLLRQAARALGTKIRVTNSESSMIFYKRTPRTSSKK